MLKYKKRYIKLLDINHEHIEDLAKSAIILIDKADKSPSCLTAALALKVTLEMFVKQTKEFELLFNLYEKYPRLKNLSVLEYET